jgi:hypothetical protein
MSDGVQFLRVSRGDDVIVDGRRVPLLEAHHEDGGRTMLVFDRRIGYSVTAYELDAFATFLASVIEGCLDYRPHFPQVSEITGVE